MLKKLLQRFRKRKVDRRLNRPYLLLSEKDIEKLRNGGSISIVLEEYVPELIVWTEERYNKMLSDVKPYKYD